MQYMAEMARALFQTTPIKQHYSKAGQMNFPVLPCAYKVTLTHTAYPICNGTLKKQHTYLHLKIHDC